MAEPPITHFFTGEGALCGARAASRWTLVESRTSCAACRELIQAREQFEAEASARSVLLGGTRRMP